MLQYWYDTREKVKMNYLEEIKNILVYNDYANKEYMLENAIKRGHIGVVKLLLEYNVNVHADNNYALRYASEKGHVEIVRLLLEEGNANVHAMNNYALRYASRYGHTGVVRVLLEYKADVHAIDDYALIIACEKGHVELVKLYITKGHYNSSMDKFITENFYEWMQEFPIHPDFKRTVVMEEVERRYLDNEKWIKSNRKRSSNFSDISIMVL